MGNVLTLVGFVSVPLLGGFLGSKLVRNEVSTWYKKLKIPSWTPKEHLFPIIWSILYTTMGISSWLIFKQGSPDNIVPLSLYAGQLVLNFLWSPIFFKFHRPGLAFLDIFLMDTLAIGTTVLFFQLSKLAGWLMCPYIAWGLFAARLNWTIWKDNPNANAINKSRKEGQSGRELTSHV